LNLYLFNDNDSAAVYGIGTYLHELTHALKGTSIIVRIVHLRSVRAKFEIVKTDHFENWYIPEVRYENTSVDAIQEIEDYFHNVVYILRLYIKDTKDLIFQFNYVNCQLLAKELKAAFDCKTVVIVHYTKWHLELQGNLQRLHSIKEKSEKHRNSFEQIMYTVDEYEGALYKEVDRVVALSQHMKNILEDKYQLDQGKISVISNGLKDITSNKVNDREVLRRKWCISDNEFVILFVGRLHSVKGLIFLIRAFRKLLEEFPDCRLIIAGNGNYDEYLQEAKDICMKLSFTGLLEKKELYELYQIANLGVVPSLYEPFGYVAVEMMMHELPIVATVTSGLSEVVDDTCGLKVPVMEFPDNVEIDTTLLAQKILYILTNPAEAREMGQNGRKRYLKEYTSEVFRRNMLQLYESLY